MTITVDEQLCTPELAPNPTLGDAMAWLQAELAATGKVVVKVEMDGQSLDGPALTSARSWPIDLRHVAFITADQKQLARTMVGKLAALVEYLAGQHAEIAQLIEKNQSPAALERLGGVISAWQQIQQGYASTVRMLRINLDEVQISGSSASALLADFCNQLASIQEALQNHDLVLLADILQYEMDKAIATWVALLEAIVAYIDQG